MDKRIINISIRGRIAYLIMCFERYVVIKYPERDWTAVDDMMWKICDASDSIDNSAYRYMEIIPEYLYEFGSFEESDFDYLSNEEYEIFKAIIPKDDSDLNTIMHGIYSVAMEYAYTGIPKGAPDTIPYIQETEHIMVKNHIELPCVSNIKHLTDEQDWWGDQFDGRYLSIIHDSKISLPAHSVLN